MFSKACTYGIRAILFLAVNHTDESRAGVVEIAETLDVPRHFLAKILQQLSRDGLISSVKGPGGGFYLNQENLARPVLDIIESLDGPVLRGCVLGLDRCSNENPCPLHYQVFPLREGFRMQLAYQSIADIARGLRPDHLVKFEL